MHAAGVEISFPGLGAQFERTTTAGSRAWFEEVRLPSAAPFEYAVPGQRFFLALHDIVLEDGEVRAGGGPPIRDKDLRGTLTFLPGGVQTTGWSKPTDRRQSFTAIHFDAQALPNGIQAAGVLAEPSIYFRSPEIERVLVRLRRSLHDPEPFAEVLRETLFDLAVVELATHLTGRSPDLKARHPLSAQQVQRVRDYMRENLSAPVTLSDLAAVLGLSKFHFARSYKSATGRSPYADLLHIRVATARGWIDNGVSLEEAARRAGFSTVRALSDAHDRILGRRIMRSTP